VPIHHSVVQTTACGKRNTCRHGERAGQLWILPVRLLISVPPIRAQGSINFSCRKTEAVEKPSAQAL
jgi:hypothetical protein